MSLEKSIWVAAGGGSLEVSTAGAPVDFSAAKAVARAKVVKMMVVRSTVRLYGKRVGNASDTRQV